MVRLGQDWSYRTRAQVFAVRSQLSVGLDVLGATENGGDIPDGQFVAWLGQFQWARRLPLLDAQLLVRADAQLADSALLGLEQFAIGGHESVRGYHENEVVRDNGFVGSVEARIPIWSRGDGTRVELVPFFDLGWGKDRDRSTRGPTTLSSLGLGVRASLRERIRLEAYWGEALRDLDRRGDDDLQDHGIHLRFAVVAP